MKIAIIAIIIVAILFIGIRTGIEKTELNECEKWAEQADQYPDFNYTSWQKKQCRI